MISNDNPFFFSFSLSFFFFETVSHYVAKADLNLQSVGITGMHHHTWALNLLPVTFASMLLV
jgi:hypothetical protein